MAANTPKRKVIAVCGKGGVGKTAFTAILTRVLVDRGDAGRLLVIDADPALGLALALGIRAPKTIADVRSSVLEAARSKDASFKIELAGMLDYLVFESLVETDDYAFMAMGRTEAAGCYCSVNSLLRDSIEILSASFDTILIDGEAGLEQINRQVMGKLDALVLLTDGSARGLRTVELLFEIASAEKIITADAIRVVLNRPQNNGSGCEDSIASLGTALLGVIPFDPAVANYDAAGLSLMKLPLDSPALRAVSIMAKTIFSS